MRLSRTDFVPLLAIIAGGIIGASLSFSVLARSRSVDVSVTEQAVLVEALERAADASRRTLVAVVRFEYDESDITAAAERLLRAKLPILRNSPTIRLRLAGHADERGSTGYNLALGNRRAQSVQDFLSVLMKDGLLNSSRIV